MHAITFGRWLASQRTVRGLTLSQLQAAGLDNGHLTKLEKDEVEPTLISVLRFAEFFNLHPADMVEMIAGQRLPLLYDVDEPVDLDLEVITVTKLVPLAQQGLTARSAPSGSTFDINLITRTYRAGGAITSREAGAYCASRRDQLGRSLSSVADAVGVANGMPVRRIEQGVTERVRLSLALSLDSTLHAQGVIVGLLCRAAALTDLALSRRGTSPRLTPDQLAGAIRHLESRHLA